jgi:hypothetical protein
MKKLFLVFTAIFWLHVELSAQVEMCITYDDAGNRTYRTVCCTACLLPQVITEDRSQVTIKTDMERLVIVPNPNRGVFSLSTESVPINAQVFVYDLTGLARAGA